MAYYVSQTVRNAVFERIGRVESNGRYLNVYEAAQDIQDNYPQENVALEDIVATFVEFAAGRSLALEFSQPKAEGQIPIDIIVRETA